ncbi:MFS transporter [Streptomyces specialis]|uniref:MFS transporter n=1 Tax=Streptomyces specialis TaxID=498367 RepID=UPI000ADEBEA2|nr:MFS transporter [Streptomyces specialis]
MSDAGRRKRRAVLAVTCLGQFMVLLDNTIVMTALPDMQRDLSASLTGLQWIVDSYVLVLAVLLLTGGAIGDRYGRKRLFLTGLAVFTCASVLCGLAGGTGTLIAARALQGAGAAALSPGSLSLLVSAYTEPRERARAIGLWAGISGLGLTAGPLLGGVLVDAFGWQAVFLVNLPVGLLTLILGLRVLDESRAVRRRDLDLPGVLLATAGVGALTFGLINAGDAGWASGTTRACLAAAAVLLVAFVITQARSRDPMLPLGLFRERLFTVSHGAILGIGFGLLGTTFFLSQFFQLVQGCSAFDAGLRTLPTSAGILLCGPAAGRLAARFGFRLPVATGLLCAGAGLVALAAVQADSPYGTVWWRLALLGVGFGLALSPLTAAAVASVPPDRSGLASGTSNTGRQLGAVFGVAALGALVHARQADGIADRLDDMNLSAEARAAATDALSTGGGLAPADPVPGLSAAAQRLVVGEAFTDALNAAFLTAGVTMLGLAALTAVGLTRSARNILLSRSRGRRVWQGGGAR